ncbi:SusC/RagA family TonB-linked outer membrane protein [Pedobacter nutrimenti]|uniref:SusC/RagA family TonB-linked outer membrane protein n=1 Tax=Pedobacter nutrimenti TaxID=1241337 RepID=UPI00292DA2C0|nr:SusC/RagA family TonB-linked outer membrane protein [Pedobacter nutrimenti]
MMQRFTKFLLIASVFLFFLLEVGFAQDVITVRGKVLEGNEPLPGVTVSTVNANGKRQVIASTDNRGEFSVKVSKTAKLDFNYIGYANKSVEVKGQTYLTVKMSSTTQTLESAIIVGYQRKTKETVTGSVTRITADQIRDVPVSSVEQLLQGKVPGLNIQNNTGAPGFRGSTAIRGLSQIGVKGSGNNAYLTPSSPLYVVDGIPIDANSGFEYGFESKGPGTSPLALIPPEDVESIDVMKDADASSLYGSRGANGVIVITTKRGNSPIPIVRLTSSFFVNSVPQLRPTIGGKEERESLINRILSTNNYDEIYKISLTQFLADSLNAFYNNATDWQGLYYQPTFNQTHNLSVSGGNLGLNYKTNLNYYTERGVIKNTGFDRYSVSSQIGYKPNPKLNLTGSVTLSLGSKLKGSGNGLTDVGAGGSLSSSLLPGPSYFLNDSRFTSALNSKNDSKTYSLTSYIDGSYELLPLLRLGTTLSVSYIQNNEDSFTPALANNEQSKVYGYVARTTNLYNRTSLNYSKTFGQGHTVYAGLFSEITANQNIAREANLVNGPNDHYFGPLGYSSLYNGFIGITPNLQEANDTNDYTAIHSVGAGANLSYDYLKKYVINLNYRADGNSYAGVKSRWAKSPALGLKWNIEKESFMKKFKWLDYASARFSYGINLRPSTNAYASLGSYSVAGNYNNVPRISPKLGVMPNPFLKPERVEQYNAGFDISVLNSKISLTVDAYQKVITDMLFTQDLPTSTGFTTVVTNSASMMNKGLEFSLGFRPLPTGSKLYWNLSLNAAINRDVLLSLPGGVSQLLSDGGAILTKVGRNTLSNFLYISQGVYSTDKDVPVDPVTGRAYKNAAGGDYKAGDVIYKDVDGNYITDKNDLQLAGNPIPKVTGGFYSVLTYGQFGLTLSGSFTFKRDLLNNALSTSLSNNYDPFSLDKTTMVDISRYNYWKQPGDVAKYPNPLRYLSNTDPFNSSQTLFQEDGSYFKLNSATVSYSLDKNFLKRYGISTLRVYATGNNLFLLSKYSGPNPENVTELGRDRIDSYPNSPSYVLGLNLEF